MKTVIHSQYMILNFLITTVHITLLDHQFSVHH